jgi:hypothetical protein
MILIPKNSAKLKAKVTIKWLVKVKLYGINPIKLTFTIKKKIEKTKGKKS